MALLLGRVSGLARELLLAFRFGVSREADVAVVLLTLPDLLVNLLLSGGLSAALVPRLRTLPDAQAAQVFQQACLWALTFFGALALLIAIWPAGVVSLFAPGLSQPTSLITAPVAMLVALSIPLTALSGVTTAYLNAGSRYFIAGLGTFIFNAAIITALAWWQKGGLLVLSGAIAIGALFRLASQMAISPPQAWRKQPERVPADPRFRKAFTAGVMAASLALVPAAMIRAAASLLGPGNIAAFNYAQKLVELPLGIFITTISTIALTRLSGHHADGDPLAARRTLHANLRLSLILALFILLFGEALAGVLVSLVFERGTISAGDVERIASLTRIALLGIPFISVSSLATAALNAQLRTPEVLRATGIALIALIVIALPGLIISSDRLLMGSVVGSQGILAWLLARRAKICLMGPDGVVNRRFFNAVAAGCAVALPFAAIPLFLSGSDIAAIGLGAIGFGAGTSVSAKILGFW